MSRKQSNHPIHFSSWRHYGLVIGLMLVLLTACGRDETPTPTPDATTQGNPDTPRWLPPPPIPPPSPNQQ